MKNSLSNREEQILLLLKRFDFMTRDQLQRYFRLGGVRNTNRVLGRLEGYLQSVREGYESIYYLSREGREYVSCDKVRRKGSQVRHIVMRNEFWLFSGCPSEWRNEVKVSDGKVSLVCDSMFKKSLQYHFLEVDNIQKMNANKVKIQKYLQLKENKSVIQQLGHFPTIVWLTTTELRRKKLQSLCKELPCIVYTITDIH